MKLTRFAALVAVPATLALAACGGGTSGVIGNGAGTAGQQANLRFVHGDPNLGPVDVYVQASGAAAPSSATIASLQYGNASVFYQEAAPVAYSVIVRPAGASSTSAATQSCPIPQLQTNAKYTVVIVQTPGNPTPSVNCALFQDFDYTSAPQYRFHEAAYNTGRTSYDFGVTNTAATTPGSPSTVNGNAPQGLVAVGGSTPTYTQAQPLGLAPASGAAFAIGTGGAATGQSEVSVATLPFNQIFNSGPGTPSMPNSANSLNYPQTAGTSVFAIDCTAASAAALGTGFTCTSGVTLIGTFD
ncbi:MAG: DUF4397 domain-containing protein, partial [Candidatus Eremiobacteraeota bacterium]|nr:DUF4397 domain-containing protein [Candidatus Eremiobacteraeota bacterium]